MPPSCIPVLGSLPGSRHGEVPPWGESKSATPQSRRNGGGVGGLSPPNKAPRPPNWNVKHYNKWSFGWFYNVKAPRTNENPPRRTATPPHQKLSGDASGPPAPIPPPSTTIYPSFHQTWRPGALPSPGPPCRGPGPCTCGYRYFEAKNRRHCCESAILSESRGLLSALSLLTGVCFREMRDYHSVSGVYHSVSNPTWTNANYSRFLNMLNRLQNQSCDARA